MPLPRRTSTPGPWMAVNDLVGGGQELGFDLAGDQESGRQRNGRHDEDPQHPAARHDAILLDGEITDFRAFAGVVSKSANGGRNARFRLPDRPASI